MSILGEWNPEVVRLQERNAELEAALREIARQVDVAGDPDHITLALIGRIAKDATETQQVSLCA